MKIAPGTRRIIKKMVTSRPKMVTQAAGSLKEPIVTKVEALLTTSLPFCRPRKAMKIPIPAEMANFKSLGMLSTISSRSLKTVIKMKMIEATKTAARAVCHFTFMPMQTV